MGTICNEVTLPIAISFRLIAPILWLSFSSSLLLFDYLTHTKYILPESSSNKKHIKHHKSTSDSGQEMLSGREISRGHEIPSGQEIPSNYRE